MELGFRIVAPRITGDGSRPSGWRLTLNSSSPRPRRRSTASSRRCPQRAQPLAADGERSRRSVLRYRRPSCTGTSSGPTFEFETALRAARCAHSTGQTAGGQCRPSTSPERFARRIHLPPTLTSTPTALNRGRYSPGSSTRASPASLSRAASSGAWTLSPGNSSGSPAPAAPALELPDGVAVVQRVPNRRPHTFPSEVVKCRLADGRELSLFAKYQAGAGNPAHGHRGGVAYEADVYRHVLRSSSSSTPRFHGSYSDVDAGETWLVIEYLDGGQRVVDTTAPKQAGGQPRVGAMPLAAAWLGHFHSEHEAERDPAACLLTIYDGDYYTGWARRTALLAADWRDSFPWLATLCMRGAEAMTVLQGTPLTVVHGEFYPGNVLIRNGTVYPIDWESAAVAAGEIDLAALIEHWPVEIARRCIRAYR